MCVVPILPMTGPKNALKIEFYITIICCSLSLSLSLSLSHAAFVYIRQAHAAFQPEGFFQLIF